MKSRLLNLLVLLTFLAGLLVVQPAAPVHALGNTWTVESNADGPANAGNCPGAGCRLRDAIAKASSGDTIKFNLPPASIITLTSGELVINLDLTITGPTAVNLTLDGNLAGRVFNIGSSYTVSISGLTISHGHLVDQGGAGIVSSATLTLDHVVISNNTVASSGGTYPRGGGINASGILTITNSTISGNDGYWEGGGIYFTGTSLTMSNVLVDNNQVSGGGDGGGLNLYYGGVGTSAAALDSVTVSNNHAPQGGGLFNYDKVGLSIINSTFSSNSATAGNGGGIYNYGLLTITNLTFSGNSATSHGGGLYNFGGTASINNSTFSGNSATIAGGGIYQDTSGGFGLSNTILANSSAGGDCTSASVSIHPIPDDHNLIMSNSGCGSPVSTSNPQLAALTQNDGLTKTMAIPVTSPAVDAGNNSSCSNSDQRGHARPRDGGTGKGTICDIGAFELDNDDFNTPQVFSSVPYNHTEDSTGFTVASDDPPMVQSPCNSDHGLASAWFSYTPPANQFIYFDSFNTNYDTVMTVWTGPRGSLTAVACNDTPDGVTPQAGLGLHVTTGVKYYIEIIQFRAAAHIQGGVGGGNLNFHVNFVSPFADVPNYYWAFTWIYGLYNAGVTGGCNAVPLKYCPTSAVTRDQMAVFLLKGKHGSSYVPPAVGSSTGFTDVPISYWAATWIKELALEGITGGCGAGTYCPISPVTRDQMALFLLKGEHGSGYAPPPVGSGTGFTDVPTSYWAAAWIKQLALEGITAGCGGGNYCPTTAVSRDQMAVFLDRAFGIPVP